MPQEQSPRLSHVGLYVNDVPKMTSTPACSALSSATARPTAASPSSAAIPATIIRSCWCAAVIAISRPRWCSRCRSTWARSPMSSASSDGIVEEITTAISRLPWLFVIARNSSFTYKGRAVDVKQVARELGVRYVLEGSVRKAVNRVRITGQLIDTTTGAHIWAERFDGVLDDIFELQDQVASSVAGAVEPKLRQSEIERAVRKPTESLDAYDLYLCALALRYQYTERSMREAIALLERARAIDPSYAPAIALIGNCRLNQRSHGLGRVSDAEVGEALRWLD